MWNKINEKCSTGILCSVLPENKYDKVSLLDVDVLHVQYMFSYSYSTHSAYSLCHLQLILHIRLK